MLMRQVPSGSYACAMYNSLATYYDIAQEPAAVLLSRKVKDQIINYILLQTIYIILLIPLCRISIGFISILFIFLGFIYCIQKNPMLYRYIEYQVFLFHS